jgi:hypothetical protein
MSEETQKPRRRIIQQNFSEQPKPAEKSHAKSVPEEFTPPPAPPRVPAAPNLFAVQLGEKDRESLFQSGMEGLATVERLEDYLTPELRRDEINKVVDQVMLNQDRYLDLTRDQLKSVVFNALRGRGFDLLKHFDEADLPELKVRKREEIKREKERQAQADLEMAESAKAELKTVLETLALEPLTPVQESTLKYFYQIYIEDKKDPELAKIFPKSTRDQRYQWKARGIQMVLPHVSENTKHYLGWRTKRKFASASEIYEYSKLFLQRIGELK